ncbi:ComF family protein [Candidatus Wolfebacteria bacterium]|nr:ComF family protein [Candidatus Wolfebacteria bacterium]
MFVLIKIKNIVLDILFPPICLNCQKYLNRAYRQANQPRNFICNDCYSSIRLNSSLFCPVCRLRLADNKKICGHADYLLGAAGDYDDPILRNLIHYFKYESFENLTPILGEIIIKYIENCKLKIENYIVVPVPLHRVKERQRGFNQAKLLAEYIVPKIFGCQTSDEHPTFQYFGRPTSEYLKIVNALKRIKNTKPQACLRRQAQCKNNESRTENIKNCFKIKDSTIESIKNKNILLIDDVFTSGATVNEAVKILKQNNARKIIALVMAKA